MPVFLGISTASSDAKPSRDFADKDDNAIKELAEKQAHNIQILFQEIGNKSGYEIRPLLKGEQDFLVRDVVSDFLGKQESDFKITVEKGKSDSKQEYSIPINAKSMGRLENFLGEINIAVSKLESSFRDTDEKEGAKIAIIKKLETGLGEIAKGSIESEVEIASIPTKPQKIVTKR